jgi:hypothetical protein
VRPQAHALHQAPDLDLSTVLAEPGAGKVYKDPSSWSALGSGGDADLEGGRAAEADDDASGVLVAVGFDGEDGGGASDGGRLRGGDDLIGVGGGSAGSAG